jgi:4a-hydroxytetrahydrobiopterin dehydratase
MELRAMKCEPCEKGTKPMDESEARNYIGKVSSGWELVGNKMIRRTFKFKDFKQGLDFVNRVGEIAEFEGHHPDIILQYGKVEIELSTHSIGGLSVNDFILADKIDALLR